MNPQTDEILEGLRPRMHTARVAHVRRMFAGVALVPLIGVGAIAMAADGAAPAFETADGAPRDGEIAPDVKHPDIGDAADQVVDADADGDAGGESTNEDDDPSSDERNEVLGLGALGTVTISYDDGVFEFIGADLAQGWEVAAVDVTDEGVVIVAKKGESLKVVAIKAGVRDEFDVKVDDLVIPKATTTTTTTTTAKPAPPSVVVDRFTVTVAGKGSFIVEREGDTLWVGKVTANAGFDHEVVQGEGRKVYVRFTNGEWVWYGKALINDAGEVEQHFWDEAPPFEPIHQWVEVPGVGAVKFKLWSDGLVYVLEWTPVDGHEFHDHHEGQPAEVAKIVFEGEGERWVVEAWRNDDGGLSYSVTDASPG